MNMLSGILSWSFSLFITFLDNVSFKYWVKNQSFWWSLHRSIPDKYAKRNYQFEVSSLSPAEVEEKGFVRDKLWFIYICPYPPYHQSYLHLHLLVLLLFIGSCWCSFHCQVDQNLVTIGLGEGVGVAEMLVKGSRGFKITGSGISRGTAPNITWSWLGLKDDKRRGSRNSDDLLTLNSE